MQSEVETVRAELRALIDPEKAVVLPRFFKTGPGQYGEGDRFHGVVVPKIRKVALAHAEASEAEIVALLDSEYHEERMVALLILIEQYRRGDAARQEAIFRLYLASTERINNWDLVDLSAPQIVGAHIYNNSKFDNDGGPDGEPVSTGAALLTRLSASPSLWERRIAIIATLYFIRRGNCRETFRIAQRLLGDEHDLIHKAVGWMLREAGKHCSMAGECAFLDRHATAMPRTMLRYAIERFPENLRRHYLKGTSKKPADKARRSEKSGVYTW